MNKPIQAAAEREIGRAITADEHANAQYYQVLRSFIPGNSIEPEARLDSVGLKAIDAAWIKLSGTSKNLRRAYMKLYGTYL